MRIERFDLLAYGPFTERSLDLSAENGGFQIIYGDNEAGKSTALRALTGWLFGIPGRTSDNFLHNNSQLRIGGKLKLSNNQELEFVRRKGVKGTVLNPNTDTAINDAKLQLFIPGGIDENLFIKLYGINYERLITGGQELLEQSGELGQALFSAASGTANLRQLLSDLQDGADEYFKPRATTKKVNQDITRFKEAIKESKEASLPVAEWKSMQKEYEKSLKEIKTVEEEIAAVNKENSRLERLNRVKGPLAERRNLLLKISEMEDVLIMPLDFNESRKEALHKLQTSKEQKEKAEGKLTLLKKEAAALQVREELVSNEEEIMEIYRDLGAVEKTIKDLPQQDGKRRQLRNEAEKKLSTVRTDMKIDDAEKLRPLLNNKKWIFNLATQHDLLKQKETGAETNLKEFETRQKSIKRELASIPPATFKVNELKAEVAAVRKAGDLEKRLAETQKRADEAQAACVSEFSRLGRFSGTIDAFLATAMPVPHTLDIFEKRLDEHTTTIRDLQRKEKELAEEYRAAHKTLQTLLAEGEVPSVKELHNLRASRDKAWQLIKGKYIEQTDVEGELLEFAPATDLPRLYENKITAADHLSDQLRLAADQVVKRAELEARLGDLKHRQKQNTEDIRIASEELAKEQNQWQIIWEPLGIDPGKPGEMKQWLLRAENLVKNLHSSKTLNEEALKLKEQLSRLKESIARQIQNFDSAKDPVDMSLEAMISLCEQKVEQVEDLNAQKKKLEHELEETAIKIKKQQEELEQIRQDKTDWQQEWSQAIEGLAVKPDLHPHHATERFEQLLAFFESYDQSEELRKRIYGMELVEKKFEEKVFNFAGSINFPSEGKAANIIASELHRFLSESREAKASLKKIEHQINDLQKEIKESNIAIKTADNQLAALRQQAAVENNDQLESIAEKSHQKRTLLEELNKLEQELARSGDGLGLEALEKEASESDVDAVENDLSRIKSELKELQDKRDQLRDQSQTLLYDIKANDGSARAANASAEAEEHLASLTSNVENYLRLQIASLILEQQIENYRQKNQAPVLCRAGQLFSRLTLGSFASLRDEINEDGKPVLLGIRPNNTEVTVDGMSDGTRDQLHLSLRLATLEQHLEHGEPMPFIVDDILIGFDDDRTRACLEILADLSNKTQVILFTHHRRVIDLSKEPNVHKSMYIHELS